MESGYQDTKNHIFKFSVDHMLGQSNKDNQEKRKLKLLVITIVEYIDSLSNAGSLSLVQAP